MEILSKILLGLVAVFLKAFALSKLWQWFLVPKFNFPEINTAYALGLLLIVSFIAPTVETKDDVVIASIGSSSFMLITGWVLQHYI